jgi:hypothetical protein
MPVQKESVEMPDMLRSALENYCNRGFLTAMEAGGLLAFCPEFVGDGPESRMPYFVEKEDGNGNRYKLAKSKRAREMAMSIF